MSEATEKLRSYALTGVRTLGKCVLPAVRSGLWTAFKRALLFGFVATLFGAMLFVLPATRSHHVLAVLGVTWVPLVASMTGAIAGAIRGFLQELGQQIQALGVVRYLYALVRPTLLRAANSARALPGMNIASTVHGELDKHLVTLGDAVEKQKVPWIERTLVMRIQRILTHAGVRAVLSSGETREQAIAELESTHIDRLEQSLGDAIGRTFQVNTAMIYGVGAIATVAPFVVAALIG